MAPRSLPRIGIIGTVIAAVCRFTPVLLVLLCVIGPSVVVGWLDYVLLPTLPVFVSITLYAFMKARSA